MEPNENRRRFERRTELIAALVMAVATVCSAWSAYQATRWSGVQAIHFAEAAAARVKAARLQGRAERLTTIDVGVFLQLAQAYFSGDQKLFEFLLERQRPEMKVATDAWLATRPLKNPDAPPTPFAMPEYRVAVAQQATETTQLAEIRTAQAKEANQRGDNYVLLIVLFASVLFFAGVGSKLESRKLRLGFVLASGTVLLATAAVLITFPVH